MNENDTKLSERDEIELLVPFYVTGRISAGDARRVDAYLRANPDFAEHIELAREERAATTAVNEALGFPSPRATDRLFEQIAAEPKPAAAVVRAKARGLLSSLGGFFASPSPTAVRYAAIAAAAVVFVQAAAITSMLTRPDGDGGYRTAAGPDTSAAGGVLALVGFRDTATVGDISSALRKAGAVIVEGPLNGGLYRIRVIAKEGESDDARRRLDALKADQSLVKMVLPSH